MRVWVMSDLHLEFAIYELPRPLPEADVCVLAGDISRKGPVAAVRWAASNFDGAMPVILVAGNHDYYGSSMVEALAEAKQLAASIPFIHLLENRVIELGSTLFFGCTLWTDFALHGAAAADMLLAWSSMSDYKRINYRKRPFQRLSPSQTLRLHQESKSFIETMGRGLAGGRKMVIVTHHAPSACSVPRKYSDDPASPAYASRMDDLIERVRPSLWIHGHIHERLDYRIGTTRVVCNPRGYPDEDTSFDERMVLDIG